MTHAETAIMRHFRNYRIGTNEMLFFNTASANSNPTRFKSAMASLIRDGLVVEERRKHAYSLTDRGFVASLSA